MSATNSNYTLIWPKARKIFAIISGILAGFSFGFLLFNLLYAYIVIFRSPSFNSSMLYVENGFWLECAIEFVGGLIFLALCQSFKNGYFFSPKELELPKKLYTPAK